MTVQSISVYDHLVKHCTFHEEIKPHIITCNMLADKQLTRIGMRYNYHIFYSVVYLTVLQAIYKYLLAIRLDMHAMVKLTLNCTKSVNATIAI